MCANIINCVSRKLYQFINKENKVPVVLCSCPKPAEAIRYSNNSFSLFLYFLAPSHPPSPRKAQLEGARVGLSGPRLVP